MSDINRNIPTTAHTRERNTTLKAYNTVCRKCRCFGIILLSSVWQHAMISFAVCSQTLFAPSAVISRINSCVATLTTALAPPTLLTCGHVSVTLDLDRESTSPQAPSMTTPSRTNQVETLSWLPVVVVVVVVVFLLKVFLFQTPVAALSICIGFFKLPQSLVCQYKFILASSS